MNLETIVLRDNKPIRAKDILNGEWEELVPEEGTVILTADQQYAVINHNNRLKLIEYGDVDIGIMQLGKVGVYYGAIKAIHTLLHGKENISVDESKCLEVIKLTGIN